MGNPATPAASGRRPQSGQALVEFTVGLMAMLLAVVAILVVGALGRAETDAMDIAIQALADVRTAMVSDGKIRWAQR